MFKKYKERKALLNRVRPEEVRFDESTSVLIKALSTIPISMGIYGFASAEPFLASVGTAAGILYAGVSFLPNLMTNIEGKDLQKEQIIENEAGQTIKGPTWALELLKQQQQKITELSGAFNVLVLTGEQKQKLGALLEEAKPLQKEVTVVSAGDKGAGSAAYEFVMTQKEITVKEVTRRLSAAEDLTRTDQKLPMLPVKFIDGGK